MAVCAPFSTSFYNNVPYLYHALSEFREKHAESLILELGAIFVKHNVWDKYCVSINHNHFKIEEGEILVEVESLDLAKTVALPWAVIDGTAKPCDNEKDIWTEFHLVKQPFIVPRSWAMDENGVLQPFEFSTSPNSEFLTPSKEFTKDIYGFLKRTNLVRILGIRAISSDESTYETTPKGKRANVTSIGWYEGNPNDMVQVSWRFNSLGGLKDGTEFCGLVCTHYCNSHSNCNSHNR